MTDFDREQAKARRDEIRAALQGPLIATAGEQWLTVQIVTLLNDADAADTREAQLRQIAVEIVVWAEDRARNNELALPVPSDLRARLAAVGVDGDDKKAATAEPDEPPVVRPGEGPHRFPGVEASDAGREFFSSSCAFGCGAYLSGFSSRPATDRSDSRYTSAYGDRRGPGSCPNNPVGPVVEGGQTE